jgi:hypothetical protein
MFVSLHIAPPFGRTRLRGFSRLQTEARVTLAFINLPKVSMKNTSYSNCNQDFLSTLLVLFVEQDQYVYFLHMLKANLLTNLQLTFRCNDR